MPKPPAPPTALVPREVQVRCHQAIGAHSIRRGLTQSSSGRTGTGEHRIGEVHVTGRNSIQRGLRQVSVAEITRPQYRPGQVYPMRSSTA